MRFRYGPPEVVRVVQAEKPAIKDNELLVRVYATTVNRTDCAARAADRNRSALACATSPPGATQRAVTVSGMTRSVRTSPAPRWSAIRAKGRHRMAGRSLLRHWIVHIDVLQPLRRTAHVEQQQRRSDDAEQYTLPVGAMFVDYDSFTGDDTLCNLSTTFGPFPSTQLNTLNVSGSDAGQRLQRRWRLLGHFSLKRIG